MTDFILIAGFETYYSNGKRKEKKCYTPVLRENGVMESVLCGSEIYYDESGKETRRTEHNTKCEFGFDLPEVSYSQVYAIIDSQLKEKKDKRIIAGLKKNPVIGKVVTVDSANDMIEVEYKTGFELNNEDMICFLNNNNIISFECKNNINGKGVFKLIEDKGKKISSIDTKSQPLYYKKNTVKYTDNFKSGSKPKAGDIKIIAGIEFVYIPEGDLIQLKQYGYWKDEQIHIQPFWITKYEVTLGEYLKWYYENYEWGIDLPENKTDFTFNSRYPANLGKHYELAGSFCRWFGNKHGVNSVLPSNTEWEYAARGGTAAHYYWSDGKPGDYCWYKNNSRGKLHPVGLKKPNSFGLLILPGMHGNGVKRTI